MCGCQGSRTRKTSRILGAMLARNWQPDSGVMNFIVKQRLPALTRGYTHSGEKLNIKVLSTSEVRSNHLALPELCLILLALPVTFDTVNHTLLPEVRSSLTFNSSHSPAE